MKKIRLKIFLVILLFVASLAYVSAQPRPDNYEQQGDPLQPAPVGSGLVILAGLAAAYAAGKVYFMNKKHKKPLI